MYLLYYLKLKLRIGQYLLETYCFVRSSRGFFLNIFFLTYLHYLLLQNIFFYNDNFSNYYRLMYHTQFYRDTKTYFFKNQSGIITDLR